MRRSMRILTVIGIVFVVVSLCLVGAVIVVLHQIQKPELVGKVLHNVTILDPKGHPRNDLTVYSQDEIVVSEESEAVLDAGYRYRLSPGSRVTCRQPSDGLSIHLERGTLKVEQGKKRIEYGEFPPRIVARDIYHIPASPGLTVQVTDDAVLVKAGTQPVVLDREGITLRPGESYLAPKWGTATTIPSQP